MRNCLLYVGSVCLLCGLYGMAFAQDGATRDQASERVNPATTRVLSTPIAAPIVYEFSRNIGPGRLLKKSTGAEGEIRRTYRIEEIDGKTVKKLIAEDRTEPIPIVFLMGKSGYQPSRGAFTRTKVVDMNATAYPPFPFRGSRGRTANGMTARYGLVAVDPRVIPLGTHLFVEGYGFALAADTGGAIKGNRIDLCYGTNQQANAFGRKKVRVHILKT